MDLEALDSLLEKGRELQRILRETPQIVEYLRLIQSTGKELNVLPRKADCFVLAAEAAHMLRTTKGTLYRYVEEGKLTPYFIPYSRNMRFKVSDIEAFPRKGGEEDAVQMENRGAAPA